MFDPSRLQALGITANLGFTHTQTADDAHLTGTMLYLAPEVMAGQTRNASSDVYALGVLKTFIADRWRLHQTARSGLGGEEISDPLLREDIAEAAYRDPAKRIDGANELADGCSLSTNAAQSRMS